MLVQVTEKAGVSMMTKEDLAHRVFERLGDVHLERTPVRHPGDGISELVGTRENRVDLLGKAHLVDVCLWLVFRRWWDVRKVPVRMVHDAFGGLNRLDTDGFHREIHVAEYSAHVALRGWLFGGLH